MVAEVNGLLHIRIFNSGGEVVGDREEKRLSTPAGTARPAEIRLLRKALQGSRPPHDLNSAERHRVICLVADVVKYKSAQATGE